MIPEDRLLSPHTGWTRAHWEALADAQLTAVRPYSTDRHALLHLPGPASRNGRHSDGLEGFARTFLLAGFRLARSGDNDPHGHAGWYAEGLAAGTDPRSLNAGRACARASRPGWSARRWRSRCTRPGPGSGTGWTTRYGNGSSPG
ncbi:DUF2264 domain-containing protein [Streptomyces sp. AD2-2]|nr:DUF2264 domain-containing protein [Streptomyces sp. AD2-2]